MHPHSQLLLRYIQTTTNLTATSIIKFVKTVRYHSIARSVSVAFAFRVLEYARFIDNIAKRT